MNTTSTRDYSVRQLAAGVSVGSALGFLPLISLQTLVFLAVPIVFRVSFRTFLLGWIAAIPFGFMLDPIFDRIGSALLSAPALTPLWVTASSTPMIPLTSFNNTVMLGSFCFWIVMCGPLYLLSRLAVARYRDALEGLLSKGPALERLGQSGVVRRLLGLHKHQRGWVRTGFVIPLGLFLGLVGGSIWLYAARGVHTAIERVGTELWGATVDVGSLNLGLTDGRLALTGLQVTDPKAPTNNLIEIGVIAVAMSTGPLLKAKVAIDSIVVQDVRFNTRRETPGEVDTLRQRSTVFQDEMARWKASTRIPALPILDLSSVVDFRQLDPDSLATVVRAKELTASLGAARSDFEARVRGVDPRAQVDALRSLLQGIEGASLRSLGILGAARTLTSLRSARGELASSLSVVSVLQQEVSTQITALRSGVTALEDLREGDYRRAMGVLNLPSFDPDDISAALLQAPLMERVEELLYWIDVVDEYLPDSDGSRSFRGPERLRRAGSTVHFPPRDTLPLFSLSKLEGSVDIGEVSGFTLRVLDLNSDPSVVGRPTVLQFMGESGAASATLDVIVDRVNDIPRDELRAELTSLPLPSLEIAPLGARLDLGEGDTRLVLSRTGSSISGNVTWNASGASWLREGSEELEGAAELLWRTLSSLTSIEITLGLSGTLSAPDISIGSNIGRQVAQALRAQVGDEFRRAEARARAEVDRLIGPPVADARAQLADMESRVGQQLGDYQRDLDEVRGALESRLRELTPGAGG